jgi:N-acetylglucosamine malate deacetylase 1
MKILIIAPHMDDEVLGCGGTIVKHAKNGDIVSVIIMANRAYNHIYDKMKISRDQSRSLMSKEILGYKDIYFLGFNDERLYENLQEMIIALEKCLESYSPDMVYIPFRGDNNQDHRSVFDAARVAIRPSATPMIKRVLMYEVPSSTEQSPPLVDYAFIPNCYIGLSQDDLNKKISALHCYKSEKRKYPHPRSEKSVKILASKRGIEIGVEYAEAFMIIRDWWL